MWPFGGKKRGERLAAAPDASRPPGAPHEVSVLTTIVSESTAVSPFTGMRAAVFVLEVVERIVLTDERGDDAARDRYVPLGSVVLGDVLTLRDADGDEVNVAVRRAVVLPAVAPDGATPITRMPPELVPFLQRASGRGVICHRELALSAGDKVRMRAVVEASTSVVGDGYRSGTRVTYVARDDLGPVVLEEVFEPPAF